MAESNMDPFVMNVAGVEDLVSNRTNKIRAEAGIDPEGATSEKYDALEVDMSDEELLKLRDEYEKRYATYGAKIKSKVDKIHASYLGKRASGQWLVDYDMPIASNLQFEALETFLAAAMARNPDPVVFCDNTDAGNQVASAVKTMLQFHSDQLAMRRKLTFMARQHEMDLLGVLKPGWNKRINDVAIDNRKVRDYILDPKGYVDVYGDFSSWYGERISVSAEQLVQMFPKHKEYITASVEGRMGTEVTYTEWWPDDEYCFYSYKERVLDKHKNQYYNYPQPQLDQMGQPVIDPMTGEPVMTKPRNHFAHPKKPGIFLSVYSLQEQPHDITSNTEQNIPQQNRITKRTEQIDFNISAANNGYAFSEDNFNQETGKQAANARRVGNPILIPSGGPIDRAILPLPAQSLPEAAFKELEISKADLRTSWGTQGITAQPQDEDTTARGMILNQAHDTSRIGGGVGDAIEQVADNVFNWLVQLYYVFYDEPHFAAIMGNAKAVEYITLTAQDLDRQIIVSVAPDSMKPKDDITQANQATQLFEMGAIGPKTLLKMLDFPDVEESAADGVLWKIDPMTYFKLNFPDYAQQVMAMQQQDAQMQMTNEAQAQGMKTQAEAQNTPPEQGATPPTMAAPPSSSALSNVPLSK